jgi:hypothetical protein
LGRRINVNLYFGHFGFSETGVLSEYSLILLVSINVTLRVHELASHAVGTELFLMELFTSFSHEFLRKMGLLD